jgi:hypothetical protein
MRNAPTHPRDSPRRSQRLPRSRAASSRTSGRRRSYALHTPNRTEPRITPCSRRASPAGAVPNPRRRFPRKTRTALSGKVLSARTRVPARHKAAAPACLAPRRMHQPMPATQARLPIERGMLQRLRGRTAEFRLNVHEVNVAVPSDILITRDLGCPNGSNAGFPP